jgi:hypothetical protein
MDPVHAGAANRRHTIRFATEEDCRRPRATRALPGDALGGCRERRLREEVEGERSGGRLAWRGATAQVREEVRVYVSQ